MVAGVQKWRVLEHNVPGTVDIILCNKLVKVARGTEAQGKDSVMQAIWRYHVAHALIQALSYVRKHVTS